jgi:hypothetical protein
LALARGELHGLDDLRIGGAAAQVAGKIVADVVLAGRGIFIEQLARHQDEARRAEAALKGARFDEGFLHRIELAAVRETLDGFEAGAVGEYGQEQTARHGAAVDDHRAASAQSLGAALSRAAKAKLLQQLDQILMRRDGR